MIDFTFLLLISQVEKLLSTSFFTGGDFAMDKSGGVMIDKSGDAGVLIDAKTGLPVDPATLQNTQFVVDKSGQPVCTLCVKICYSYVHRRLFRNTCISKIKMQNFFKS